MNVDGIIPVMGPTAQQLLRVLTLQDFNTRVVVIGVMILGLAAGVVGAHMLLRKRALLGDALAHATLPGIALAFMLMVAAGASGKWLPGLLLGATISGAAGVAGVVLIRRLTRIKEDAALGIVLSVFFGFGVVLMGIAERMGGGSAAGLQTFIFGKTAAMLTSDVRLIAGTAVTCLLVAALLYKELKLLSFDSTFAAAQGWPVGLLDGLMMATVTAVTVVGLQAVGLILVIALLITPAAAARFWTDRLGMLLVLAAVIGSISGWMGASISALLPRLPAGAIIVSVAAAIFLVSLLLGPRRGLLARWRRHVQLQRQVGRQNLLRACYELVEEGSGFGVQGSGESSKFNVQSSGTAGADTRDSQLATRDSQPEPPITHHAPGAPQIPFDRLLAARSWSARELRRLLWRADREELVNVLPGDRIELTEAGLVEARRVVREHRLWELYLITHADVAPSHVDRGADMIEHVLGRDMVDRLERLLEQQDARAVPATPHLLASSGQSAVGSGP